MRSLFLLTKKNLKLLIRAKSSALIVVFAPLLVILLLGLSYNTTTTGLKIGVYAPAFSDEVNAFVATLQEEDFTIITYEGDISTCVEDIKSGEIHTCISVPASFQVEGNSQKEITFYIDPSRINLVWMIQEVVGKRFDLKSQQVSQQLTQTILTTLSETNSGLSSRANEVTAIKEKTGAASSSATTAQQSLAGVDVSATATAVDTSFVNNISSSLTTADNRLTDALAALQNSNISSSERAAIKEAVEAAKADVQIAYASVNGTAATSIGGVITLLQQELNATQTKLAAAATAISSSSSSLSSATTALQESVTTLESLSSALAQMKTQLDNQKVTDASIISAPLITKIEKVSPESTYLNYSFPSLLVLVLMFSSLLLGTTLVMMEKTSPAFLRNFFLPLRKSTFVISTYLTNLCMIIIQLIIILGISVFFLKDLLPLLPATTLILFVAASVFTFLGMAIGYIFTSEETGVLASISLGSLLLFVSGVILPLESVSPLLRDIVRFNPFVLAEKLLRDTLIFSTPFTELWVPLLFLVGYAVIFFLIILIAESLLHKHLVHRFLRNHHRAHRHNDKMRKNEG